MRKLILIAVLSLVATQAHAGGSRSLSLAAVNASQPTTEQPAPPAPPQTAPAPAAARPANIQTATVAPTSTQPTATTTTAPAATTVQPTAAPIAEAAKPKHRKISVEARVIRELHRHGIYW